MQSAARPPVPSPKPPDKPAPSARPGNVPLLIGARAARGIGQGAMVVDFALYLRALGWSGAVIGSLLMATLLVAVLLTAVVGPVSDRIGRRRFLLVYESACILAALAALLTTTAWVLVAATLVAGFGRGANGSAGPFAPAEQAWLAQTVPARDRGRVYSLNSAVGFVSMAAGALIAALPARLAPWVGQIPAYRLLFLPVVLGSIACLGCLLAAQEDRTETTRHPPPAPAESRQENKLLLRLALANILQGTGIGLTGPLIAYWFAVRFGRGPGVIGPLLSASFILAASSSLLTGHLTARHGIVRVVVGMRLVGLALMIALPLVPSFPLAAAIYLLRSAFNRGTAGARQALSLNLVRPHRHGLAASLNAIALQIPRAIGPALAGVMLDAGLLRLPFLIGAAFQAGYVVVYHQSFRNVEAGPPER